MMDYTVPAEARESAEALLAWASANEVEALDIRFTDIRGMTQHFSMPLGGADAGAFEDGFGFDGSSVRGFQSIEQSDLILMADLNTALIDPFYARKTLTFVCDIYNPVTGEPYGRDPRGVARRAEAYLAGLDLADTAYFGPELEFFMFSNVRYQVNAHKSYYEIDSHEGSGTAPTRTRHELPEPHQAGLLPPAAAGQDPGCARGHGRDDGGAGHRRRGSSSRSGRQRPGGDRPEVQAAA